MSLTIRDGDTLELDPLDLRVVTWDWDEDNLDAGVAIATSTFAISADRPDGLAISSITRAGATATVTTASAHGYATGDWVSVEGADQADYNITAQVIVTSATTWTMTVANAPTTPATGTMTVTFGLGKDNATILSAAPYNSRFTQLRLIGGGVRALGRSFRLSATIVTNETPTQTKNKSAIVVIADL